MQTVKTLQNHAFSFALKHINHKDDVVALTAIILLFMCTVNNPENKTTFHKALLGFEKRRQQKIDLKHLNLLLQYISIYKIYEGCLPEGVSSFVAEYYTLLSKETIDAQLLPSYILLKNLNAENTEITDKTVSLQIEIDFQNISDQNITTYVNAIALQTSLGQFQPINVPKKLITMLEISLIEACRSYSIEKISTLLKALSYLNAPKGLAIKTALSYLQYNQSTEGFIGYYEKDFSILELEKNINTVLIQLSSTLFAINGLVAYELGFNINKLTQKQGLVTTKKTCKPKFSHITV